MILENLNRVVFAGDSITDMQRAYRSAKDSTTERASVMSE